jgi:hypothetical protein
MDRVTKPTALLPLGAVLAAAVMAAGMLLAQYEERETRRDSAALSEMDRAQERCIPLWLQAHQDSGPGISNATLNAATAACADARRNSTQSHMHATAALADRAGYWTPRVAGAVLALLATLWICHGLLRRIAVQRRHG